MGLFDFLFGKKKEVAPFDQKALLRRIEVVPGLSLPKAFALQWPEIEKAKKTCIRIHATPSDILTIEQSKFGHYPCLPVDFEYPKDINGKPMYPLAQINFREVPALQDYPNSGFLQFYISGYDDVYGLDFDDPQSQKNFRVLYFEEGDVLTHKTDLSFLDEVLTTDMTPVHNSHQLSFSKIEEYAGPGDALYERNRVNVLSIAAQYPSIEDELCDFSYDFFETNGHKIGGYAYFTQSDPRGYNEKFKDYVLLFQLDSDDHIMWGDVGVANFFIHPDNLAKKDFSKVLYNWDCS